jgi:AmiR/NasT family two-component response regulator
VSIERAIGIIAERTQQPPREAFEELRKVARSNGQRVHDIAIAVVASVTDPTVALPGNLPSRP